MVNKIYRELPHINYLILLILNFYFRTLATMIKLLHQMLTQGQAKMTIQTRHLC